MASGNPDPESGTGGDTTKGRLKECPLCGEDISGTLLSNHLEGGCEEE